MRLCTKAPIKFISIIFAICIIVICQHVLQHLIRRHSTHSRYLDVVQGQNGEIMILETSTDDMRGMVNGKGGMQHAETKHVILCLDAYLTQLSGPVLTFPICIHEPADDQYISHSLYEGYLYEHDLVQLLLHHLQEDPELGLLDIGANLGVYALSAAQMNRKVVAVEALPSNVLRLRTAISLGWVKDRVTVVEAAVSNSHDVSLYARTPFSRHNIGSTSMVEKPGCFPPDCDITKPIRTIFMDDLVDVIPFKKGIMKIDIEGFELRAIEQSSELFEAIDFQVVLMEWRSYGLFIYTPSMWDPVEKFIKFFTDRDYLPCDTRTGRILVLEEWDKWPVEVIWKKSHMFSQM